MFGGQTRCITGDVQMEDRASSRLWVLAVIVGVKKDIKRDGWVSFFIINHCGKKLKVAFTTRQLHFFYHPHYTHVRKTKNNKKTLSCVSRTKTSPVTFCHQYSQGFVLGPLLITDTRCADHLTLAYSFLPNPFIASNHPCPKKTLKKASLMLVKLKQKGNCGIKNYSRMPNPDSCASLYCPL